MMKRLFTILVFLYFAFCNLFAQDAATLRTKAKELEQILEKSPGDYQTNLELGEIYFSLANILDEKTGLPVEPDAANKSADFFQTAHKLKKDALSLAWYGSAKIVFARDSSSIIAKLDAVQVGIEALDKAVVQDPENILIRQIRIETYYGLPDMFKKRAAGMEDVNFLLTMFAARPEVLKGQLDPGYPFLFKARYLLRDSDAKMARLYVTKGLTVAEGDFTTKELNALLKKLEGN